MKSQDAFVDVLAGFAVKVKVPAKTAERRAIVAAYEIRTPLVVPATRSLDALVYVNAVCRSNVWL